MIKKGFIFLFLGFLLPLFGKEFLQEEVDQALSCIQHPNRAWVYPKYTQNENSILDVAIIGGGQTGLTMAFSLKRHCIHNIRVFDLNPEDAAGSWIHVGRMPTLRTPKTTTGPDLDIPVLSIKYWYCKKYGLKSWENLDFIPRLVWHDYLNWFRKILALPVQFNSMVDPLFWDEENEAYRFTVTHTKNNIQEEVFARKVVLATGLEGSGEKKIFQSFVIPKLLRQLMKNQSEVNRLLS